MPSDNTPRQAMPKSRTNEKLEKTLQRLSKMSREQKMEFVRKAQQAARQRHIDDSNGSH